MNGTILSALIVAACMAVTFSKLCTPAQWEGGQGSIAGYVHDRKPGIIKEYSKISYDATNKRKAKFLTYVNNEFEDKFQMIIRYGDDNDDSGRAYIVDLKKNKCWSKKLSEPFRDACIPDGSKSFDYRLGLKEGKNGFDVTNYEVNMKHGHISVSASKAGDAFIPVGETVIADVWGTSFLQTIGFLDITPGIQNASVFDIPKLCKEETEMSIPEFIMHDHHVFGI